MISSPPPRSPPSLPKLPLQSSVTTDESKSSSLSRQQSKPLTRPSPPPKNVSPNRRVIGQKNSASVTKSSPAPTPHKSPLPRNASPEKRIPGQWNPSSSSKASPAPTPHTSKLRRHDPFDSSRISRLSVSGDTSSIISPYSSSSSSLRREPHDDSFFPLQHHNDDPNEVDDDENLHPTSAVSNGNLIASSQQLTSLEIPPETISLIYQTPQEDDDADYSNAARRRGGVGGGGGVGVQSVHSIILSHNHIATILNFDKLSQFSSLTSLDLSFNKIQTIQRSFPPILVILKLNHNQLESLPGLLLCSSLRELHVSHNKIKIVDGLPGNLKKLDLSYNLIDGDLNLRMLGLCPHLTSINVDQNPVVYRHKSWRPRLLSLLPKLEEINHEIIPRVRKVISKTGDSRGQRRGGGVLGRGQGGGGDHLGSLLPDESSIYSQSIASLKSSFPASAAATRFSSHRSLSPKKRIPSPSKVKQSEQQAHDEQRYREYESLRKSREKLEKEMDTTLRSMSKSIHKKPLPEEHLMKLSLRLNSWKPLHVKKLEENQVTLPTHIAFPS
jgi:hypothetical protein